MVYKKVVVVTNGGAQHCSTRLSDSNTRYRAGVLAERVSRATGAGYVQKAREIGRIGGSMDYSGMVTFL